MPTANLKVSATYASSSGTISYAAGTSNYLNLSDASDTSNATITGTDAFALWPILTNLPIDIESVTAIQIDIRASHVTKGDISDIASVQIFKSDGSTAISSAEAISSLTGGATTYTVYPSVTLTDQTSWNDAHIKVLTDAGAANVYVQEITVTITYTDSGSAGPFDCAQRTYAAESVTNVTDTGEAWVSLSNAEKSDGTFASCTLPGIGDSDYLLFGFSMEIPADATVLGIEAVVIRYGDYAYIKDSSVQLAIGGTASGDENADTSTIWPTSSGLAIYGGPTDIWGLTIDPSDLLDFGLRFQAQNTSATSYIAYVDAVVLTVYYSLDSNTGPAASSSVEFLRPIDEANTDWSTQDYTYINNEVYRPDGGTGSKAETSASSSSPQWDMSAPAIFSAMVSIKVWLLVNVEPGGSVSIQNTRINLNGNWYAAGPAFFLVPEDPTWFCVEFTGITEDMVGSTPVLEFSTQSSGSDTIYLDEAYMEVHYAASGATGFFYWF